MKDKRKKNKDHVKRRRIMRRSSRTEDKNNGVEEVVKTNKASWTS